MAACARPTPGSEGAAGASALSGVTSAAPSSAVAPSTPAAAPSIPRPRLPADAAATNGGCLDGEPATPWANAKRVLHVGDSMVPLVGNYLRPVVQAGGGRYEMISTHSSGTRSWAADKTLSDALAKHDPDLVLISLGSNELFESDLEPTTQAIRAIVAQLGARRCMWIAPPAWTKNSRFLDVLQGSVAPCRYFDSTRLKFKRQADGRHPDWSSSHRWASEVWRDLGGTTPIPTG